MHGIAAIIRQAATVSARRAVMAGRFGRGVANSCLDRINRVYGHLPHR